MAEPALDALLETLHDVDAGGKAEDCNGRLSCLRNIEEVVEECLPRMCGEEVELVDDEYD